MGTSGSGGGGERLSTRMRAVRCTLIGGDASRDPMLSEMLANISAHYFICRVYSLISIIYFSILVTRWRSCH